MRTCIRITGTKTDSGELILGEILDMSLVEDDHVPLLADEEAGIYHILTPDRLLSWQPAGLVRDEEGNSYYPPDPALADDLLPEFRNASHRDLLDILSGPELDLHFIHDSFLH